MKLGLQCNRIILIIKKKKSKNSASKATSVLNLIRLRVFIGKELNKKYYFAVKVSFNIRINKNIKLLQMH